MNWLLIISAVCISALSICAQDIPPQASTYIRLVSDPCCAEVWRGDSLLGITPLKVDGRFVREYTAYYPSRNSWNASAVSIPDSSPSYLDGAVILSFTPETVLRSIPSDAAVYRGESYLGRTPLRLQIDSRDTLTISKPGYSRSQIIVVSTEPVAAIVLEPLAGINRDSAVTVLKPGFSLPPARILAACAVGIGAGVAAVMMKQEADSRYESYRNGNSGDLDKSRRFDLYSGIALAMLEASIAYLLIELFDNS